MISNDEKESYFNRFKSTHKHAFIIQNRVTEENENDQGSMSVGTLLPLQQHLPQYESNENKQHTSKVMKTQKGWSPCESLLQESLQYQ